MLKKTDILHFTVERFCKSFRNSLQNRSTGQKKCKLLFSFCEGCRKTW